MEYDIDKLIVEMDFNSLKMSSCKNGLLLTNQEVEVLRRYDIDYESCSSLKDVLFKIEDVLSLEVIDDAMDLENISQSIAERDYYQNTNKWGIYIINYMLDKLNKLEKKDVILGAGDKIVEELINNKDLDDSERLMAIEYAVAKLNNILYNISGDEKE